MKASGHWRSEPHFGFDLLPGSAAVLADVFERNSGVRQVCRVLSLTRAQWKSPASFQTSATASIDALAISALSLAMVVNLKPILIARAA